MAVIFILKILAEKLLNFAATEALQECPNNSIDMKTLRIELGAIVKDQLIEDKIQEQEGRINAVIKFLKNTYQSEKNNGAKKEDLYKFLDETYEENLLSLNEACTILSEENFKRNGISTYIAGQEVLFSYIQEKALQDPSVMHYTKSKHVDELVKYVRDAIIHVNTVADLLYEERCSDFPAKNWLIEKTLYEKKRSEHIQSIKDQLKWIYDVIENWRLMLITLERV